VRFRLSILFLVTLSLTACATRQPADDLTISTRVKIELLADPQLGALRLEVSTLNGIVTLSGTVQSQADADRAAAAARRVPGVRGVKPELKIGGGASQLAPRASLPVLGDDSVPRDAERAEGSRHLGDHPRRTAYEGDRRRLKEIGEVAGGGPASRVRPLFGIPRQGERQIQPPLRSEGAKLLYVREFLGRAR
jgi:hypothetical protein